MKDELPKAMSIITDLQGADEIGGLVVTADAVFNGERKHGLFMGGSTAMLAEVICQAIYYLPDLAPLVGLFCMTIMSTKKGGEESADHEPVH